MKKQGLVIAEVDDFIKHVDDGDLIITPEARKIMLTIPTGKNPLGLSVKEEHSLAELLSCAIGNYQVVKDCVHRFHELKTPNPLVRQALDSRLSDSADELLRYIKRSRVYGVIEDRNLTNKLKEYEKQNLKLKETVTNLETELLKLKQENEELHKALGIFGDRSNVTEE
jgi:hypothetical protein